MADVRHVRATDDRWRQVVCARCRMRGPARPAFDEAVAGWRALTGGPLVCMDALLAQAERLRDGVMAYDAGAPGSGLAVFGKLMELVVSALARRRDRGWR